MEMLQLRYFFESAKYESFAKTAEKYMVPTTSVSASVKRLEKELGCTLFDRSSNRITLNANGKRLQNSLILVFSELDDAVSQISANSGDDRQIKLLVRAMRRNITDLIIRYSTKHPHVAFKTVFDFRENNFQDYDIIIDEENRSLPEFEQFELYRRKLRLKCAAGDPMCEKNLTMKQLSNRNFVSMGEESNLHRSLIRACQHSGFTPNICVMCNDIECYEKFIASGMGIAIGTEKPEPEPGIAYLNVSDFDESYGVTAYYKKSACYGNIKSFLDFLKSQTALK